MGTCEINCALVRCLLTVYHIKDQITTLLQKKSFGSHLLLRVNLRKEYSQSIIKYPLTSSLENQFLDGSFANDVSQQVHVDIHSVHRIEVGYAGNGLFPDCDDYSHIYQKWKPLSNKGTKWVTKLVFETVSLSVYFLILTFLMTREVNKIFFFVLLTKCSWIYVDQFVQINLIMGRFKVQTCDLHDECANIQSIKFVALIAQVHVWLQNDWRTSERNEIFLQITLSLSGL